MRSCPAALYVGAEVFGWCLLQNVLGDDLCYQLENVLTHNCFFPLSCLRCLCSSIGCVATLTVRHQPCEKLGRSKTLLLSTQLAGLSYTLCGSCKAKCPKPISDSEKPTSGNSSHWEFSTQICCMPSRVLCPPPAWTV